MKKTRPLTRIKSLRLLLPYLKKQSWIYLCGLLLIIGANITEIIMIRFIGTGVEDVAKGIILTHWGFMIMALACVVFLLRICNRNIVFYAGRSIESDLREQLFHHEIQFSMETMDRFRVGDLCSRLVNDVSDARMLCGAGFLQVVNTFFAYTTTILAMLHFAPGLALFSLIPFPLILFSAYFLTNLTHQRARQSQEALGSLSSVSEEFLTGVEVIKSCSAETWSLKRFQNANEKNYLSTLRLRVPEALLISMMMSSVWLGVLAVLLASAWMASRHAIQIKDLATFIFLFSRLVWPTVALGWVINIIQRGLTAMGRIGEILHEAVPSGPSPANFTLPSKNGELEVQGLHYAYPLEPNKKVLHNISFHIHPREWVALVGPSGGGKSTLAFLISGLLNPPEASIFLDKIAQEKWPWQAYRDRIGSVPQVPHLFSLSIAENLRFANNEATDETLWSNLRLAQLENEILSMKDGLKSELGERGLTLSGGQRQRATLARALIKNPALLLLDDSLSSLDIETEIRLWMAIRKNRSKGTTLFITQKLAMARRVDRILVLEKGKISASGSHEELLKKSLWYQEAWEVEQLERKTKVL